MKATECHCRESRFVSLSRVKGSRILKGLMLICLQVGRDEGAQKFLAKLDNDKASASSI